MKRHIQVIFCNLPFQGGVCHITIEKGSNYTFATSKKLFEKSYLQKLNFDFESEKNFRGNVMEIFFNHLSDPKFSDSNKIKFEQE